MTAAILVAANQGQPLGEVALRSVAEIEVRQRFGQNPLPSSSKVRVPSSRAGGSIAEKAAGLSPSVK